MIKCLVWRPDADRYGLKPYCPFRIQDHERIAFIKHLRAAHNLTFKAAVATYEDRVMRAKENF